MSIDVTFQYPPELFNLLVSTIPVLNPSKKDVLLFFSGAGVPEALLHDLAERVRTDRANIGKHEIARTVLERLNKQGEAGLRDRREVLRRVAEFTSFDACWPKDQMSAKGYVASVREIVNQKDAFTRINQEREQERRARISSAEAVTQAAQAKQMKVEAAKMELYGLFGDSLTPHQRGKKLEAALNGLFAAFDLSVRESFHLTSNSGAGIVEQIDGVIELAGALYFVEMKWYKTPVGVPEISQHFPRLMTRAEGRGLVISASDFTGPAVETARSFLQHKVIVLCHLEEIVRLLDRQGDLVDFLKQKSDAAIIHRNPYFRLC